MGLGKEMAGWLRGRATLVAMLDRDNNGKGAPRIHPRRLPQTAKPQGDETSVKAIVYHKISDVSEGSLEGVVSTSNAIMQFDCYGSTPDQADQLRDMLKSHLNSVVYGNLGTIRLLGMEHDGDRDAVDEPINASDDARFISQVDYRVMYHNLAV